MRSLATLTCLLCLLPVSGPAAFRFRTNANSTSAIALRERLHVNSLISPPGTGELDWANLYSASTRDYSMPSALKYTPRGTNILWGRTEYSVAFDTLQNTDAGGGRLTQFSQAVTLNATAVIHDGDKFDFAIAPQASFFTRDESGARLGATAIGRYDSGRNSTGVTASWTAATHNSDTNPAGLFDAGFGYGRNLQGSPLLDKITPHTNVIFEKATGQLSTVAIFEGVEFQMTPRFAIDLTGQHFSINRTPVDNQIVLGITLNLGHAH